MIAYTTFLLFLVGIFSSIRVGVKVDKVLSFFTFTSLFLIFAGFCDGMYSVKEQVFSFNWKVMSGGSLDFDIVSNSYNYWLVLPCFMLTMLSALNSFLFRHEERRSSYLSVLIFNLVALIILIASNSFVQLLSALFAIDILALFMVKDVGSCSRYILLNIFADMLLFMVLAVINCQVASLDIRQIVSYRNSGTHQDFVALVGLTAVFAKFGFFMFQIGITELKKIRFHRMQNILFMSSPLAAMILLIKFSILWRTSGYFTAYLDFICILTILWGCLGAFCVNNFKSKIVYWQMSFWALFVELLRFHGFVWFSGFSFLLLEMYAVVSVLYLAYYYNGRRILMTDIRNFNPVNKKAYILILIIMAMAIAAFSNTLAIIYNNMNRYYIWTFAILFVLSLSTIIKQLIIRKENKLMSENKMPIKIAMFTELFLLCIFLLQDWRYYESAVWLSSAIFILLCLYNPLSEIDSVYRISALQNSDVLGRFYHVVIKSFRLCGRAFWLLIDRLFMEKIVLSILASGITCALCVFRKIQTKEWISLFAIVLLAVFLWISYFGKEYGL